MARLHFISGSIALITLAGVNAEPCRPSSSVVTTTTGLATTATMSTDIGDTTTVLLTFLTVTESTETCYGLPSRYTAPGGTKFDFEGGRIPSNFRLIDEHREELNFKTCVSICDGNQESLGAAWAQNSRGCYIIASFDDTAASSGVAFAKARSRNT
jgi:hypothetical protein